MPQRSASWAESNAVEHNKIYWQIVACTQKHSEHFLSLAVARISPHFPVELPIRKLRFLLMLWVAGTILFFCSVCSTTKAVRKTFPRDPSVWIHKKNITCSHLDLSVLYEVNHLFFHLIFKRDVKYSDLHLTKNKHFKYSSFFNPRQIKYNFLFFVFHFE